MTPEIVLNLVWAVCVWTAAATACVLLMRRAPAVLRRQICRLGLIGVPIAMLGVGLWHSNRPGSGLWVRHVDTASVRAAPEPAPELPAVEIASLPPAAEDLPDPSGAATPPLSAEPAAPAPAHVAPAESPRPRPRPAAAAPRAPAADQPGEWWPWLLYPAGGVSLLMLLTLAARQLRLTLWRRTWRPATPAWQSLTARLARRIGLRGPVRTFMAERLRQPAAAGIVRPAVVLPAHHSQPLGPALRGVLAHEVAHLRGRDPLWNLISGAVLACAWWCPLTWWLHRRMRIESELTADDHALAAGAAPIDFAETLARLAEGSYPRPAVVMSQMACHLKRRIKMMLNERIPHSPRSPLGWRLGLTAAMCLVCAALICTPLVGVVRADDPKPAAGRGARRAPRVSDPRPVGRGSASEAAVVTTRPKGTVSRQEVASFRISAKGGRVVIETSDGQRIEAKEIVAVSTSDAGKTAFTVGKRGDRAFIVSSLPSLDRRMRRTGRAPARPQEVRIFALKHANAHEIEQIVATLFRGDPSLRVVPQDRMNALVVAGTGAEMALMAALLEQLDVPGPPSADPAAQKRVTKIFALKHARAADLARMMGSQFAAGRGGRFRGTSIPLQITPDPRTNTIVVAGAEEDIKKMEVLLAQLDVPGRAPAPGAKDAAMMRAPGRRRPAVGDPQLRALHYAAERRVIDFEANLKLAQMLLSRAQKAHRKDASKADEVEAAKIQLDAAKKKLDLAKKELDELQQLAGKPARPAK